jgi:hypothetical protein
MASPHSTQKSGKRISLASLLMVCLAFTVPTHARMVAVYVPKGVTMNVDELKAFALAAQDKPEGARSDGLTFKLSEKAVLTAEFSVPPGVSAYFWADETFSRSGYVMGGEGAHYEADIPSEEVLAKPGLDADAVAEKVFPTEFRSASLAAGKLTLAYSVTKSGRVLIEAYGANGQRVGSWRVHEAAGDHARSFGLNSASKGPLYVRWTAGNMQAVRKVTPASAIPVK